MTVKVINQLPLTDVAMCEVVTRETTPITYRFKTADEVGTEEVVSEGEEQTLKIKGVVYANKAAEDTTLGYDITLKDNVFCPELMEVFQGGTLTYTGTDPNKVFVSYEAPPIGTTANKKKFDVIFYSEEIDNDGPTGRYAKVTFPNAKGNSVPLTFKDGEYYSNEYKLKSRPAMGESPYKIEVIDALPQD
jgi:hypothetical protein